VLVLGAPILDRVVAVVDRHPILLSEVRARAKVYLKQLAGSAPRPLTDADVVAVHRLYVERIIDETLIRDETSGLGMGVDNDEIRRGIESVAEANKTTVAAIEAQVKDVGMTLDEYREEIRIQILEGKWVQLRVRTRVTVPRTDEKAFAVALEEARKKALAELRAKHYIEVRP
jgi:peptidyl-prolyl cis-trans isomerase SurA